MMKIAVSYDKGSVFEHFGKTENFKIYEIVDNKIINSYILNNGGITHCALIDLLKDNGINCLICGHLGYGAVSKLNSYNIKLYAGVSGSADKAITDLLDNKLVYDNDTLCEEEHTITCKDDIRRVF